MRIVGSFMALIVGVSLLSLPPAAATESGRTLKGSCEDQRKRNGKASAKDPAAIEDSRFAGYETPALRKDEYQRLAKTDTNLDGVVCDWPAVLNSNNFPLGVPENAALFATALLEDLRDRAGKREMCTAYRDDSLRPALVEGLTVGRDNVGLDIGTASRIVDGSLQTICSYQEGPLTIITAGTDKSTVRFRSCTVLNSVHSSGLAKSRSAAKAAVVAGYSTPRVSKPLYKANSGLDRDKDGVICPARPALPLPTGAAAPSTPGATPTQTPQETARPSDSSGSCVTAEEFGRVKENMSVSQVSEIFGVSGTVSATSSTFGITVELRDYPTCTEFGAVSIVYTDGLVTSKAGVF